MKEVGNQCLEQLHKSKHKQNVDIFMVKLAVHKETEVKQMMKQWKRECLWKKPSQVELALREMGCKQVEADDQQAK